MNTVVDTVPSYMYHVPNHPPAPATTYHARYPPTPLYHSGHASMIHVSCNATYYPTYHVPYRGIRVEIMAERAPNGEWGALVVGYDWMDHWNKRTVYGWIRVRDNASIMWWTYGLGKRVEGYIELVKPGWWWKDGWNYDAVVSWRVLLDE